MAEPAAYRMPPTRSRALYRQNLVGLGLIIVCWALGMHLYLRGDCGRAEAVPSAGSTVHGCSDEPDLIAGFPVGWTVIWGGILAAGSRTTRQSRPLPVHAHRSAITDW